MSFAIAAAGTGGHVFPGLAVGEALVTAGAARSDVHYLGGDRLESTVYPEAGFPFHRFDLRGLERSLTPRNLALPFVVSRAIRSMTSVLDANTVRSVLGLGGYVTVPAALAAKKVGAVLMVSEQNAAAGLANRLVGRSANRVFGSFPVTAGLPTAEWVGNPVRREIAEFDRTAMRPEALERYGLAEDLPVLGVFGGSLGAGALNEAVSGLVKMWRGNPIQVLHLVGSRNASEYDGDVRVESTVSVWKVVDFETEMRWFYAASDLVVGRAGGAVAELGVTSSPSILVPGGFGSGGHQHANAVAYAERGAAVVCAEPDLQRLSTLVAELLYDPARLSSMRSAAKSLARPEAAKVIARAMMESHD